MGGLTLKWIGNQVGNGWSGSTNPGCQLYYNNLPHWNTGPGTAGHTHVKPVCKSKALSVTSRSAECDWDGVDKIGRNTLNGGGHTLQQCLAFCLGDSACQFASFSTGDGNTAGYCHTYQTCQGSGSASYQTSGWKVYEKSGSELNLQT